MNDSKLYASMILSISTSKQNKKDIIKAIENNFIFMGTLRIHVEELFDKYENSYDKLVIELTKLMELYINDQYPYLAGISIYSAKGKHCHSS